MVEGCHCFCFFLMEGTSINSRQMVAWKRSFIWGEMATSRPIGSNMGNMDGWLDRTIVSFSTFMFVLLISLSYKITIMATNIDLDIFIHSFM